MTADNIVLLGFMASGKSHIGAVLAQKLNYTLYDTDAIIEEEQGAPIKSIFEKKGEAYFRALETKAIKNLLGVKNAVIVTGGGAPMFFENIQMLKKLGHNFYLDVSFELIKKRLKNSDKRPLGQASTPQDLKKLKQLFTFRRPIYAGLGHSIDASEEKKSHTCDEILSRFSALKQLNGLKTLDIEYPHPYQIFFSDLFNIDNILGSLGLIDHRPLIITSDHLSEVLLKPLKVLKQKLPGVFIITIKDGEQHKNMDTISEIHKKMFELNLTRKTVVLALGGGNVGDIAGFASSIYLRGVPFVQIPTTLLAMVDSSIGGKTGVDLPIGKNLVGAFHAPSAVLLDKHFLETLPKEEFSCGMAEVIKHAIINDENLFNDLMHSFDEKTIERALKVKADIVLSDPYEQNIRAHLNLGHTFGHAIEKVSNYRIKHGFAVAIGLVLATHLAEKLGVLRVPFLPDLLKLLDKYGLPSKLPADMSMDTVIEAMRHDKKRDNHGLKLILPQKVGKVLVKAVNENELMRREGFARRQTKLTTDS